MGFELSSAALHILAMLFMLLDHLWATVVPGKQQFCRRYLIYCIAELAA